MCSRGKRVFRKFDVNDDEDDDAEGSRTILTRSSIKPRRLFQTAEQVTPEDEEAVTDIEDHNDMEESENETSEVPVAEKSGLSTPSAPRFGPATPPDTRRTTRFGPKAEESTHSKRMAALSGVDRVPKRSAESSLAASGSKRSRAI